MSSHLNYNHLYYFWVVAREGSIVRAAEQLYLTPQTISAQLRTLEESKGAKLFEKSGRRLVLTEVGRTIFQYADEMFRLGSELEAIFAKGQAGTSLRFRVGIAMVVPKLVAYRILEPALRMSEPVRMVCHEAPLDQLTAELVTHKIDVVLSDVPLSPGSNVRAFNHLLGECGVTFFARQDRASTLASDFPRCLDQAPMLVPTRNSALRPAMEQWFERERIYPQVVAEFEDGALMKAFGQAGVGIFCVPSAIEREVERQYSVAVVGRTDQIQENFYAITTERRIRHTAVAAITDSARRKLFSDHPCEKELGAPDPG